MSTKYKAGSVRLIVTMGLLCLSLPTLAAEYRCGWIENPGPGTWWLTDKDATWEISTLGGYSVSAQSIDHLPDVIPNEYVRISGIYGYSCGCISVDTDKQSRRILNIHSKGKQVFLKQCLEEKAIAERRHPIAKPIVVPTPEPQAASQPSAAQVVQQMPVPARQPTEAYYIQVITTADRHKADALKNSFAKEGFDTLVTSVTNNGKTLYRVNFGPFASKALAAQGQTTLKGIFAANANVQESILVSAKSTASAAPGASTRCFSKKVGNDLTGIQLSIQRDQVSGYYAWEPHEKDGARGYLRGTLRGNQIIASHTYMVEGYVGTEEVAYRFVKGGLIAPKGGEQVSNGPDSTRYKDVALLNWSDSERYVTVSCASIRGAINNAVSVRKEILKLKQP